jgi:membrane-associated protease RseP (regulator of RpoE activity)
MGMIVVLLAALIPCFVLHVSTMAFVGWALGATLEEVSFGFGSPCLHYRVGRVQFRLGVIPMGGYAKFKGDQEPAKSREEILFAADMEPPGFNDLHPLRRATVSASGCLALVVLAAFCLGPWHSVRSVARGFAQLVPFAPWTPSWVPEGRELAGRCFSLLKTGPYRIVLGVLAAKMAAANLLPLPPLNGGVIILTLLEWNRRLPEKVLAALTTLGVLGAICLMIYWVAQILLVLLLPA